ncbi:hypothetical protein F4677DRAFT_42729 [Hypoxylon crocopeplum]|nr:hypothetical protein F4677DRAFT_42729 [Hypoxylon crocopeplum]
MEPHPHLGELGLDDLASLTLKELEDRITHIHPDKLLKNCVLQILMEWFHEQIKKDIQKSLLSDFVNLLLTGGNLQLEPFSESEVEKAFEEWQTKDIAENPANRRRYQIVQSDFQELLGQARLGSDRENDSSLMSSSPGRRQAPPASLDIIDKELTPSWIVGGGKQKTGANVIPLGQRNASSGSLTQDIIDTHEENRKGPTKILEEGATPIQETMDSSSKDPVRAGAHDIPGLQSRWTVLPPPLDGPPPDNYICYRCNVPGHWIQLCPTNFDPSRDIAPVNPYYRCEHCKTVGQHYATLCPQNTTLTSLTNRRGHIAAQPGTPTLADNSRFRDRRSSSPPPRRRSRTPAEHPRRHDIYTPDGSPHGGHWSRDVSEGFQPSPYRGSVSPWSARERITRRTRHRELSPREYTFEEYQPRRRQVSPTRDRGDRRPRSYKELSRARANAQEGRLAYDNNVFMDTDALQETSKQPISSDPGEANADESKDEVARLSSDTEHILMDADQAIKEANAFLDALATVILRDEAQVPLTQHDVIPRSDATNQLDDKMSIDGDEGEDIDASEDTDKSSEIMYQEVHEPQFRPEVVALFRGRLNPIIGSKAIRQTAIQMSEQAYQPTLALSLRPKRY